MTSPTIKWDSNPFAYGAIEARLEGRKSAVGGISNVGGVVRGYVLGQRVYEGSNEKEAMLTVEAEITKLPNNELTGLLD